MNRDEPDLHDPHKIELTRFTVDMMRARQTGLRRIGYGFFAAGLGTIAMGFVMTDIGHFSGFAAGGVVFMAGGIYMFLSARKI